jgi:membrane-associated protease RseP (regulator of RpoE activity)
MRAWTRLRKVYVFGAPVWVHWSALFVVGLLFFLSLTSPIYAAVSIASYLSIIAVHEAGHAYIARRLGYRVTGIHIGIIHGLCEHERPEYGLEDVLISWGGVAAQLCIAVPVLVIAWALGSRELYYFGPVVAFLGYVNLLVALANLAPAEGFDGKRAWRAVPLLFRWWRAKRTAKKTLRLMSKRK